MTPFGFNYGFRVPPQAGVQQALEAVRKTEVGLQFDGLLAKLDAFLIPPGHEKVPAGAAVVGGKRVQSKGQAGFLERFAMPTKRCQVGSVVQPGLGGVGVQFDGASQVGLRSGPVPVVEGFDVAQHGMRLGEAGIPFDGLLCRCASLFHGRIG